MTLPSLTSTSGSSSPIATLPQQKWAHDYRILNLVSKTITRTNPKLESCRSQSKLVAKEAVRAVRSWSLQLAFTSFLSGSSGASALGSGAAGRCGRWSRGRGSGYGHGCGSGIGAIAPVAELCSSSPTSGRSPAEGAVLERETCPKSRSASSGARL